MISTTERKMLAAMMLLEMCERSDDPELLDKAAAAHSFIQSAWSDLRDGGTPTPVSDEAQDLVAQIHAAAAIEGARQQ